MRRAIITVTIILIVLSFTSCAKKMPSKYQNRGESFHIGLKDGCQTAKGEYTKNSIAFNNSRDYNEGWFKGRQDCNK